MTFQVVDRIRNIKENNLMNKKTSITLMLIVSVLHITHPVFANDAKEFFLKGVELVKNENYPDALNAFKASYQIKPKATVLFNIAMCMKALNHYTESIEKFNAYIIHSNAKTTQKKQSENAIKELSKMLAGIEIKGAQDGAVIKIDNINRGKAPLDKVLFLNPGKYVIKVSLDGFETINTEIIIVSGAVLSVQAKLSEKKAIIKVNCNAKQSIVYIDGKTISNCPCEQKVIPGKHTIVVHSPGKDKFMTTVNAGFKNPTVVNAVPFQYFNVAIEALVLTRFPSIVIRIPA